MGRRAAPFLLIGLCLTAASILANFEHQYVRLNAERRAASAASRPPGSNERFRLTTQLLDALRVEDYDRAATLVWGPFWSRDHGTTVRMLRYLGRTLVGWRSCAVDRDSSNQSSGTGEFVMVTVIDRRGHPLAFMDQIIEVRDSWRCLGFAVKPATARRPRRVATRNAQTKGGLRMFS